jgi:hypothetical protein
MPLGWLAKRRLRRDGYVQVRAVVPPVRVEAALRAINRSLGEQGMPPERLREMRSRTYCPELIKDPAIVDLYARTPARAVVASALGRVRTPDEAQIALRFPQGEPAGPPVPHIDGMSSGANGVPPGTLFHFTALLGVFLSDVPDARGGNFLVWPGSHLILEDHFRREGVASLAGGAFPSVGTLAPRALTARAGDIVLAHYALAHAVAPNLGPHVRYAVFFRLFHQDHRSTDTGPLTDLWRQWEGMPGRTS